MWKELKKKYSYTLIQHQSQWQQNINRRLFHFVQEPMKTCHQMRLKSEEPRTITADDNVAGCSKNSGQECCKNPNQVCVTSTPDSNEVFLDRENCISEQEDNLGKEFLSFILEIDIDSILIDEQFFGEVIFRKTLLSDARALNDYISPAEKYSENKQKSWSSYVQKILQNIDDAKIRLTNSFKEIADIPVYASVGVSVLAANIARKMNKVFNNKKLHKALRKRIAQQETTLRNVLHRTKEERFEILCMNSSNLTWEDAFATLITLQNGNEKFKMLNAMLSVEEVLRMGTLLEESTVVPIEELKMYLPSRLSAD